MDIDLKGNGKVGISTPQHLREMVEDFPDEIKGSVVNPAKSKLFNVSADSPNLNEERTGIFRSIVMKGLWASQRSRPDLSTTISFLTTRQSGPTEEDWGKLKRMLCYIKGTIDDERIIGADGLVTMGTYIDAAHAIHNDMRGQTGGAISFGWGVLHGGSSKQKLNTKSSTETELVGVSDYIPRKIWVINFLREQGYELKRKVLYQDNESTMRMLKNGRDSTTSRSRHISIRYFFTADRIQKKEFTVEYCHTHSMLADFYSKALQGKLFHKYRNVLMGWKHISSLIDDGVDSPAKERVGNRMSGEYTTEYTNENNEKKVTFATDEQEKANEKGVIFNTDTPGDNPWSWEPPDLSVGGDFYQSTVAKLTAACAKLPESERRKAFLDGLEDVSDHRGNYSGHGPTKLVLLWWEWPEEHWDSLRFGISMNFFREPTPGLLPNMKMDAEQLRLAEKFIEQLSSLGVLGDAIKDGVEIRNNFPLFLVPKAGQPGEWRCITDRKAGGQNACCISDPCLMTSPDHILPFMYRDGYSAVADMSKYFHCFTTIMGEWMNFGLIHPRTGEVLYYKRLPMGKCHSPAGSGRLGAALVRELVGKCELFRGTPINNSKVGMILNKSYKPQWGEGRVLISKDGLPAVLIKCHIDDFILHGPNYRKTADALTALLDHLFRKGLVCQHVKTSPPSQCVKYCGFLYDTSLPVPTLRIPDDKVSRALALVRFLLRGTPKRLACLSAAKVIGFLQSLVPATPSNIGASFLWHLYNDLHSLTDAKLQGTIDYYYTPLDLCKCSHLELLWWEQALANRYLSCQFQMPDMGTLSVNWGDGSGTGTGGTENWVSMDSDTRLSPLEPWMGGYGRIRYTIFRQIGKN